MRVPRRVRRERGRLFGWVLLTGPDKAHGRWYLLGFLTRQKVDGAWRFSRIVLHTLRPDSTYIGLEQR